MGETVMTKVWGEQPLLDTWIDCRNVKKGWCGRSRRDGLMHTVVYDPRVSLDPLPIARMPDADHFVVQQDGRPIGAIRIERRARRAGSTRRRVKAAAATARSRRRLAAR
jgi:hypothetical protein